MAHSNETEFKAVTDSWGNLDVAFYEAEAMKMRNEYLREGVLRGLAAAKEAVASWFSAPSRTHSA
ncbi:RSP_7527 family protein [Saccharospirillum sp.]|uniref:RSP_7527 family protein n=1 Tax=Saccharospirillum sp. TaxID=2033801 RepID=UPI0034A0638B